MIPRPARIWYKATRRNLSETAGLDVFTPEEMVVLQTLHENFRAMYLGLEGVAHEVETILVLTQDLSIKTKPVAKKERFDFLSRGIDLGNRTLRWDVPLTPVFVATNREKSYLRPDSFPLGDKAVTLVAAFARDLEQPLPDNEPARLGQLLLSAILFGGLLEQRWLAPFVDAIKLRQIYQADAWLWLEMNDQKPASKSDESGKAEERIASAHKRWVADYQTQLLIYRYLEHSAVGTRLQKTTLWEAATGALKRLDLREEDRPQSLSDLRRWALSRAKLLLPHSLVGYASGDLPSTSLPIGPWLRNMTDLAIPVSRPEPVKDRPAKTRRPQIIDNSPTSEARQIELFKALRKELSPRRAKTKLSARTIRRRLNSFRAAHGQHLSPTYQLLIHWGLQLLEERHSYKEKRHRAALDPGSVLRYYDAIGEPLLRAGGMINPLTLEPQELEVFYEQAAERKGNSPYVIGRLAQFHGYLQTFFTVDLPEIEWSELLAGDSVTARVDANLVSPRLYKLLLEVLGWGAKKQTRWQKLQQLAVILSYRCGLRPSELCALHLIDIQGITEYEILVRNNKFNTIKTNAGIRRAPITAFLSDEELSFALDFLEQRRSEAPLFGGGLVFAHPAQKAGKITDEELFVPVRKLLRDLSGDETLRLYHLRHSFLSFLHLKLMVRDNIDYSGPAFVDTDEFSTEQRDRLKHTLMQYERHGRKSMYLISLLAGHNSPKTTCRHYIHLADWLLGHHLHHPANSIARDAKQIAALTGYKRARAFELVNKSDQHPLQQAVEARARNFAESLKHPLMAQAKTMRAPKCEKAPATTALPPWGVALTNIAKLKEAAEREFWPKATADWNYAKEIYETIQALDGRRQKTAARIAQQALDSFSKRWGGIVFTTHEQLREMMALLEQSGIPSSLVSLTHHARRGQDQTTQQDIVTRWAREAGTATKCFKLGESSNRRNSLKKGCVTLKVVGERQKNEARAREPKMSRGFLFAMYLLLQYRKERANR